MKTVVCIKQVPILSAMEFDESTKSLKREGVRTEVSAFDLRAVIKAVDLRDLHGGEVIVITMGPPQAKAALIDCLALGADRAVHICDPALAGSDTLATARALAAALRSVEFDLVLAGRCSIDAETGQVGPELAELLDLPQITAAHMVEIDTRSQTLSAERETDDGYERLTAKLPIVVTAAEDLAAERFPSRAERESAAAKPIVTVTLRDIGLDPQSVGVAGSPTVVADLRPVAATRRQLIIEGSTIDAATKTLAETLVTEHGLFGTWRVPEQPRYTDIAECHARRQAKDVWVVVERREDGLRSVTFELLAKARELADALGSNLSAVILGAGGLSHADALSAHGADRVLFADDPVLVPGQVEAQTHVLANAIRDLEPGIVLLPATTFGRDLAPRIAARLGLGLTGDCIDLGLDAEGRLLQYKPAFGGSVVAPILSRTIPEMATIRPGMLRSAGPHAKTRQVEIVRLESGPIPHPRIDIVDFHRTMTTDLENAEVVVGVGMGLGEKANIEAIQPLVDLLGARLCATRDVTDAGWLPRQRQVGLTGHAIAPKLYLAIGIRGAFEHMVGVRRAGLVVAINKSPKAPIFKACDYGLVGDYSEIVDHLHRHLQRARP